MEKSIKYNYFQSLIFEHDSIHHQKLIKLYIYLIYIAIFKHKSLEL